MGSGIIAMRDRGGPAHRADPAVSEGDRDGAFLIIAWVGPLSLARTRWWVPFEVPKSISLGLIVVIFVVSYVYARRHPSASDGA
ncbi:MAG: hypothetical protein R2752_18070 [Vicinamibacterales bacterium]